MTGRSGDSRVDEAFAAYLEETDAGRGGDRARLLEKYPELAADLDAHDAVERVAAPFREFLGGSEPVAPLAPVEPGTVLGNHEILAQIGSDGQGVVYRARHVTFGHEVALKMILSGPRASEEEVGRFLTEVAHQSELDHPHIVPVFGGGEHDGRLFFTMKLVEGGSLATRTAAQPSLSRSAADCMVTIARAVHHAHRHGILHRDLKPANILIDRQGRPYVADFGLSKRVESDEPLAASYIVGAPAFLPPEQIHGKATVASDVYGLGTILYWLLSGRAPFSGDSVGEVLHKVESGTPDAFDERVDRRLAAICRRCLAREPADRYASAEDLAREIENWRDHRPTSQTRAAERLWLWCRRHPAAAAVTAAGLTLLLAVILAVGSVARSREVSLRQEALAANHYAARGVAGKVLWRLDEWSRTLVSAADAETLRRALREDDRPALQRLFETIHRENSEAPFESWYVLDAAGTILAVSPFHPDVASVDFSGRDYFRVARDHGARGWRGREAVHIGRVYRSVNDNLYKFSISAPIHDGDEPDAPMLGVIATTVTTSSDFGLRHLNDARRRAVLVARGDTGPPRPGARPDHSQEFLVLLHPGYRRGQDPVRYNGPDLAVARDASPELRLPAGRRVFAPDDSYVDPLDGGRWLAGFAPVGNTELTVLVQQRYDEAIRPLLVLDRSLVFWGGIALALGALLAGVAAWSVVRRHVPWPGGEERRVADRT